ncbi:DUF559 domain-containing protein [Geodermatophilus sp. SYSU D01119]
MAVEYEGRQHADPQQFGRDVDRYSLLAADGWLVLRFAGRHLSGPAVVVERTRRALPSRGWRPGSRSSDGCRRHARTRRYERQPSDDRHGRGARLRRPGGPAAPG